MFQKKKNGLKIIYNNRKEKANHIIKNMLYMVEINDLLCNDLKELFGQKKIKDELFKSHVQSLIEAKLLNPNKVKALILNVPFVGLIAVVSHLILCFEPENNKPSVPFKATSLV